MLKYTDVSSIYKKDNTMDGGNYRPVSILKIMLKNILYQISPYFETYFTFLFLALEKVKVEKLFR